MANIKSQIKRNKQSEKARIRNASCKSELRTACKKVKLAVEAKDKVAAQAAYNAAARLIDKAVSKGVEHANAASRQKASLQKLINSLN